MHHPRARPRFSFISALAPDEVVEHLQATLSATDAIEGRAFARTILLTIAAEHRVFWTPHLDVQLDTRPDGSTRVNGLFAPAPQIWTTFLVLQLLFGMLSVGAAIYLTSQWTAGGALLSPALFLAAMLIGGGLAFGTAYIGQGFASDQMYELRAFLETSVRDRPPPPH